jgi:uncharacterized membrane protein
VKGKNMNWLKGFLRSKKAKLEDYLSSADQQRIVAAISAAEGRTSGELRIHLEPHCPGNALDRGAAVFDMLKMRETALRNAVLIYCALEDRKFALLGDAGIHKKVGEFFWKDLAERVQEEIKTHSLASGLCLAAESIRESLAKYFPHADNDINELPNEISFNNQ